MYVWAILQKNVESVIEYITSLQSKIKELGGTVVDNDEVVDETMTDDVPDDEKVAEEKEKSSGGSSSTFSVPIYDPNSKAEDYDAASNFKQQAADAKSDGNFEKALEYYNQAVVAAPPSALLYANRAICLEKLKHYKEAEIDCNLALESNPDSAKALKVRGKLRYQHLGDWQGALSDLNQAQTIDFDPDIAAMLKELTQKRIQQEQEEAKERNAQQEKLKKRAEEIKKAQEEAAKEQQQQQQARAGGGMPGGMGGMPGGMGGMPGGMGGMPGGGAGMDGLMQMLMSDPELQEAMKNPKVVAAFSELMNSPGGPMGLMSNPAKLQELMADPDVGPVLQKLMGKFMGGGGLGGMGGMPGMGGFGGAPPGGAGGGAGADGVPDLGDLPDLD